MNVQQPDLNRLIDLLVDDELDPGARRSLFDRLDAEPDGWRRCALAFLETQTWHAAIAPVACEPAPTRVRRGNRALGLAGIAAALVGAFVLGWAAHGGTPRRGEMVAALPPVPKTVPADKPVLPEPSPKEDRVERGPLADAAKGVPTRQVTDSPLTDSVRHTLQQRGFQVEQQRRLLALELKNGQRLNVPVEEVKVRYVGNRTL